jgi:hypothetical protein
MPLPKTQSYTFSVFINLAQMEICHHQASASKAFGRHSAILLHEFHSIQKCPRPFFYVGWLSAIFLSMRLRIPVSTCWPVIYPHVCVHVVLPHLVCILADGADFLLVMRFYSRSSGHEKRYTSISEVGLTEKMLRELMKYMEEMEASGENVADI